MFQFSVLLLFFNFLLDIISLFIWELSSSAFLFEISLVNHYKDQVHPRSVFIHLTPSGLDFLFPLTTISSNLLLVYVLWYHDHSIVSIYSIFIANDLRCSSIAPQFRLGSVRKWDKLKQISEQAKLEQDALSLAWVQAKLKHFVYMASQAQAADT